MGTTKITIEALVLANKQKTWEAYTLPEHITKWNFANEEWQCPSASNDLQVGGKFTARMEAKDGSFGFDFEGVYQAIELGESLSYALSDGRLVDMNLASKGNETLIQVSFDAETQNDVDLQRSGWQAILNNFKKHVESY
jgi:uncharacterized protein YndB with AHSA1/START domain